MSEKWSERHLRKQKVEALKGQLIEKIQDELTINLDLLHEEYGADRDVWNAKHYVDELHKLYVVEDYLKYDGAFMGFYAVDGKNDVVVYKVNETTLDWMLRNEHLLTDILFCLQEDGRSAEEVLCEEFFEHQVFNIIDRCLWDDQQSKEQGSERTVDSVIGDATQRCFEAAQDGAKEKDQELDVGI